MDHWPACWPREGRLFHPRALLVDAMGTLIECARPEHETYASIGREYGVELSPQDILRRYEQAYSKPWSQKLRYEGDALPFWHSVISEATACSNPAYTESLHRFYATKPAWRLADPHALSAFSALRRAGIQVAVVSNFDSRLPALLESLGCADCFDVVAVSADVLAEKPDPAIFHAACDMLGVRPHEAVHVGDSWKNDLGGAKAAGCGGAWLWKSDVRSFTEVASRLGVHVPQDNHRQQTSR